MTLKKVIKWFSIFAVIGTAIGLVIAYFCKNFSCIKGACFCGARSIFPLLGMELVVKNIKLADNKGM